MLKKISPLFLIALFPIVDLSAQGTNLPFGNRTYDILERFEITSLFVTHDLKEAILMGDSIGYMRRGPLDIYSSVDEFIADPRTEAANEIAIGRMAPLSVVCPLVGNNRLAFVDDGMT